MFPQGELVQQDVRPIECDPGLGILARMTGTAWLAPVAFRYELVREQRPDVFIRIGEPKRVEWKESATITEVMNESQERLNTLADSVRTDALSHNVGSYRAIYKGTTSMEKRFDTITGKK